MLTTNGTPPRKFRLFNELYDDTEHIVLSIEEPSCFEEAVQEIELKKAMESELESIERNKTWELTNLPPGHRAFQMGIQGIQDHKGCKWVITKLKARLVAKGYV